MRLLGRRSLSSFLKLILDIGFYGTIVGGALLILVVALTAFSDEGEATQNFPVFFDIDPAIYRIEADERGVTGEITAARGNLDITGGRTGLFLLPIVLLLPALAAIVLVLHRLRRVFRRLVEVRPFAPGNARDLRFVGLVVIAGELALAAASYWTTRLLVPELVTSGVTLNAEFDVRSAVVFAGLVLFIVAEIFGEGAAMKSDLEAAREIQFSLVSESEYRAGSVVVHAEMRPADSVGGDYHDVIELGDGRIAFVLADVAGHGLPAALLMALLQSSLRTLISSGLRGAEMVGKLNTYLVGNTPSNRMVTFFYGELEAATGRLSYVNAGHNPPYLVDRSGWVRLGSTSVVLGSFDGAPFTEASVELGVGDRVLLFTDGVTEAADAAGTEYGEERLERLLERRGRNDSAELIPAIFADVFAFCGKVKQADDITMMLVERTDGGG